MPTLYTIGTQGKSLRDFVTLLSQHGIDIVIDIRLRNTSQLAGWSKRDDLAFLLGEGFAIAYEHHPELAPTEEILDSYHKDKNWQAYECRFKPLLAERGSEVVGQQIQNRYHAPCLLCSEAEPSQCHRRLVAEYWAMQMPELAIVHL